jgi:hypothetical protein
MIIRKTRQRNKILIQSAYKIVLDHATREFINVDDNYYFFLTCQILIDFSFSSFFY